MESGGGIMTGGGTPWGNIEVPTYTLSLSDQREMNGQFHGRTTSKAALKTPLDP